MRIQPELSEEFEFLNIPKNLLEFLRAGLAISQVLTGNGTTTVPDQYRFTRTFLNGEVLRVFDLKATELRQETVTNLVMIMDHVVAYFGPK